MDNNQSRAQVFDNYELSPALSHNMPDKLLTYQKIEATNCNEIILTPDEEYCCNAATD